MSSKVAGAAALLTVITSMPCCAQSAVDAVALTQWGASVNSRFYKLSKRGPSSVEFQALSDSNPADLKVEETSKCKFLISYHNTKYGDTYTGTLEYTAAQWPRLVVTRKTMQDGALGFQIVHIPGARYCHTLGFSPEDYEVTPGNCRDFASFNLEPTTAAGVNALKRFCPGRGF